MYHQIIQNNHIDQEVRTCQKNLQQNKYKQNFAKNIQINKTLSKKETSDKLFSQEYVNIKPGPFSKQQTSILADIYVRHQSKWSLYARQMPGRTQRMIKNSFYNSLRKLASKLNRIQRNNKCFQKKIIDANLLHTMLDTGILVENTLSQLSLSGYDLTIYQTKNQIIHFGFKTQEFEQQQVKKLIKNLRKLKFMFKNTKCIQRNMNKQQAKRFSISLLNKQMNLRGMESSSILNPQLKQVAPKLQNSNILIQSEKISQIDKDYQVKLEDHQIKSYPVILNQVEGLANCQFINTNPSPHYFGDSFFQQMNPLNNSKCQTLVFKPEKYKENLRMFPELQPWQELLNIPRLMSIQQTIGRCQQIYFKQMQAVLSSFCITKCKTEAENREQV